MENFWENNKKFEDKDGKIILYEDDKIVLYHDGKGYKPECFIWVKNKKNDNPEKVYKGCFSVNFSNYWNKYLKEGKRLSGVSFELGKDFILEKDYDPSKFSSDWGKN